MREGWSRANELASGPSKSKRCDSVVPGHRLRIMGDLGRSGKNSRTSATWPGRGQGSAAVSCRMPGFLAGVMEMC